MPGQLGQITDTALVSCVPYAKTEGTHQCLLLANPYQGVARIFDATDNQFILSPIGYFPLVVQVGQAPNKIATINNRIFTLDPINKAIYEIPTSFVSPVTNIFNQLDFSPNDFVLTLDTNKKIIAYVSQTDSLSKIALETNDTPIIPFITKTKIDHLQISQNQKYLLVATGTDLVIVDLQKSAPNVVVDLKGASVASMTSDNDKVLLGLTDKTLVVIDLTTQKIVATSPVLEETAAAVYLPSTLPGTPNPCCNGLTEWVGALLMNGKLQYWPYANQEFKTPQTVDLVLTAGVSSFTLTNPIQLLGVQVENQEQDGLSCERRLFLVYSGAIFNTCEGTSGIKRVDQMEY
ncbi:MAG: hypothetical protein WCK42_06230 [Myxococcaceae bacterium]